MIVAFLTAFYMFRVVFLAFFGTPAPASRTRARACGPRCGAGPADPATRPRASAHAALHNETVVEGAHVNETPHAHEPPVTMLAAALGAGADDDGGGRDVNAEDRWRSRRQQRKRRPRG